MATAIEVEAELQRIRKEILHHVGKPAIQAIHKRSRVWDTIAVAGSVGLFTGLLVAIGSLPFGLLWLICIVLQGLVLILMGLVNHDLFVHRKIFGDRGSWIGSVLFTLPLPFNPSAYADAHLLHHRFVGTDRDPEVYKQDLNTRWRRVLFGTMYGAMRVTAGRWAVPRRAAYFILRTDNPRARRRLALEARLQLLTTACILGAAILWPRVVIFGYFVPSLVLVPILNTIRILIEHADLNPANPYSIATFYRTSWFTRLIYLWDSGDCHLIHHIFPAVPFYRMGRAVTLIRPFLLERGVVERRSYAALIWGWFAKNYPHRSLWPMRS